MYANYDYYRIFYYVARYGGVSQAAKVLSADQPNLTRMVKNLESALGCPLFARTRRGMTLTPEGEKLYAHVRVAFAHIEAGEAELAESRNLQTGTVFVAASEVALHGLLLPVLKKYRTRYPGVRIRISNHSTPQAVRAMQEGIADFAVVTTPVEPAASLIVRPLRDFREAAVCSDAFPALCGRRVTLAELCEFPLISLAAGTMSYAFHAELFAAHGLRFAPDIEAATADQVLPMVEADLGVGFVPERFARENGKVNIVDLAEEIPTRSVCLIRRRDQPLGVAARELMRLVLEAADTDK